MCKGSTPYHWTCNLQAASGGAKASPEVSGLGYTTGCKSSSFPLNTFHVALTQRDVVNPDAGQHDSTGRPP